MAVHRPFVIIGIMLCGVSAMAAAPMDRFKIVARRLVEAINAQDYPATRRDFAEGMLDALSLEQAEVFFGKLVAECGQIVRLGESRRTPPNQAVFPAYFERGVMDIQIVLDSQDKVMGLWVRPHVESIPVPEKHDTVLRLPFDGRWKVIWGGDTRELNYHRDTPNQRYAFDFLIADTDGRTYQGQGSRNEDYYAYGHEIVAPADGVVTDVIRGVRDNRPGSMNPYSALGNAVFIRHAQREVSVLAHFKQGSICVKVGDRVQGGQGLGLCGNSGNSSEPHLHYHLQNTPVIQDGAGIKCFFSGIAIMRDAEPMATDWYSPIRGDIVEQEDGVIDR